jgi:antitoxin component YwqK of YwqJK toxin-antitoxin module
MLEQLYKNGELNGNYTEYYVNGKHREKGKMKNGKMDGNWIFWFHNGRKECEISCKNGEVIKGLVYHDNGKLKVKHEV